MNSGVGYLASQVALVSYYDAAILIGVTVMGYLNKLTMQLKMQK